MEMLKHAHSGLRWLVLASLLFAIANAFMKWKGGKSFGPSDKRSNLLALIFTHLQFTLGLLLYFMSPKVVFAGTSMKDPVFRFFLVEHIALMVLAVAVITIGYSRSKRAATDEGKFKAAFIFYLAGLVLLLLGIPWPFQQYGAAWF